MLDCWCTFCAPNVQVQWLLWSRMFYHPNIKWKHWPLHYCMARKFGNIFEHSIFFWTICMEHSAWEAIVTLLVENFPDLDGNHNCVVHESLTLDILLIQMIAGNTFKPHFLRIYVNIILPCVGAFMASKFSKTCRRHVRQVVQIYQPFRIWLHLHCQGYDVTWHHICLAYVCAKVLVS